MVQSQDPGPEIIHVFLETSILLDSHWDLEWPPLQAILKRAGQEVALHTTTVTLWEIVHVARKNIDDARQRFSGFRKYAKAPLPQLQWINPEGFRQQYREHCQFEHTGDGANLGDIIQLWLNQSPPFTEHKPPQFQDAMAFLSLHHWARTANTVIHVVAKDPDWVRACERSDWCTLSDLGALAAKLNASIHLADDQLSKLEDEIEPQIADALGGIEPIITNRPGRKYDVEVFRVDQLKLYPTTARASSDGVSATFRFEADANINVYDRYDREVVCDLQIIGEISLSLNPGYSIQDLKVTRWSFNLPDLTTIDPQVIKRWLEFDDS